MWANFISHCDEGAIFHNSRSELFHIRREPNISLKIPQLVADDKLPQQVADDIQGLRLDLFAEK